MAFNPYKHNFVAQDQFGNVVWIERHPRKELMEWAGIKHAEKTYLDAMYCAPFDWLANDTVYHGWIS